jgi:hypothetical protein
MSAERGWIGEPQPAREWHTPGWVKEGGKHFITPPEARKRPTPIDPMQRPVQAQNLPSTTRVAMAHAGVVPVVIARGAQAVEAGSLPPIVWVVPVE